MFESPEYADFYVAILTIVPIVLAGQLVLLARVVSGHSGWRLAALRVLSFLGHLFAVVSATVSITLALLVLAGIREDTPLKREGLVGLAAIQVAFGVMGFVLPALDTALRPRSSSAQPDTTTPADNTVDA